MAVLKPAGYWLQWAQAAKNAGTYATNALALAAMVQQIRAEVRDLVMAQLDARTAAMDASSPLDAWRSMDTSEVKAALQSTFQGEGL